MKNSGAFREVLEIFTASVRAGRYSRSNAKPRTACICLRGIQFISSGGRALSEPAAPGELAEHVFTSISQSVMATWFNFRTRDGAFYSDEPCSCGRNTRRMWIAERLDDMVKIKGVNIFASGVEELLAEVQGISPEFRLVVEQVAHKDLLTLQIEPLENAESHSIAELIKRKMLDAWSMHFEVECVAPGTLPRTELKARRWLDKRPRE